VLSVCFRGFFFIHENLVLTRYLPRPKIRKERSLLQDKTNMTDGEPEVRSGTYYRWRALMRETDRSQTLLRPIGTKSVLRETPLPNVVNVFPARI
jgi:hypothetical protein